MSYEGIPGPCVQCGLDETCCDHRGRTLCQDCWHAARSTETPYAVYRDADGYLACDGAYLKEEAEEWAAKRTADDAKSVAYFVQFRDTSTDEESRQHWADVLAHAESVDPGWRTYAAKPCERWFGERMAHPAYMARRRGTLLATHPEYARTDGETGE